MIPPCIQIIYPYPKMCACKAFLRYFQSGCIQSLPQMLPWLPYYAAARGVGINQRCRVNLSYNTVLRVILYHYF